MIYVIIGTHDSTDPIARGPFDDEFEAFAAAKEIIDSGKAEGWEFTIAEVIEVKS